MDIIFSILKHVDAETQHLILYMALLRQVMYYTNGKGKPKSQGPLIGSNQSPSN